jgi:hypothetical protein
VSAPWISLAVRFPHEVKPDALRAFFAGLAALPPYAPRLVGTRPAVAFETVSTCSQLTHRLAVPERWQGVVTDALRAALPSVRLSVAADEPPVGGAVSTVELGMSHADGSLRVDYPEAVAAALLAALQPLRHGERLIVQWLLAPAPAPSDPLGGALRALGLASESRRLEADERRKQAGAQFLAVVRLGAVAATEDRARALLRRPLSVLRGTARAGTRLQPRALLPGAAWRRLRQRTVPLIWPAVISPDELVAVSGLPVGTPTVPGLRLGTSRQLPPPAVLPRDGRVLLHSTYPGAARPVAQPWRGATGHVFVAGPTGSGKSTELAGIARQDMAAGHGLVLFDPKGDLALEVLGALPPDRVGDVIYLDPTDARPVGFNLLADTPERLEITCDQVTAWFARRFRSSWGPRSDDVLRHSLRTLASAELSIVEAPALLTDDAFRRRVLAQVRDAQLRGYWSWFDALSLAERSHVAAPVLNKLRALVGRSHLRLVIGQATPTWTMEAVLAERKILVCNLAKGTIGADAAALLGSLLLARLWAATLARAGVAPPHRRLVTVIADEFQDFIGSETDFGDFLAQARGLGVGLVLAVQLLAQLPPPLRADVLANARTKLVYRLGADDAAVMAREYAPYLMAADLQGLDAYELAASIYTGTTVAPAVTGSAMRPAPVLTDPGQVRARSRQRYGRDRADVEAQLRAHRDVQPEGTVGRRRRTP